MTIKVKEISELSEDLSLVVWESTGKLAELPAGTLGFYRTPRSKDRIWWVPLDPSIDNMSVGGENNVRYRTLYQFESVGDMLAWLYDRLVLQVEGPVPAPEPAREPAEGYIWVKKTGTAHERVTEIGALYPTKERALVGMDPSQYRAVKFREVIEDDEE